MLDFGITDKKKQQLIEKMSQCGLKEKDLQESFVKSSGPGGQNVNKNSTCVYLLHIPTGIEVKMQKGRSQALNRFFARRRMCELLIAQQPDQLSPEQKKAEKIRKQKNRRRRRSSSGN